MAPHPRRTPPARASVPAGFCPGGPYDATRHDASASPDGHERVLRYATQTDRCHCRSIVRPSNHQLRYRRFPHQDVPGWRRLQVRPCDGCLPADVLGCRDRCDRPPDVQGAQGGRSSAGEGYPLMRVTEFTVSALLALYLLVQLEQFPNHLLWVYLPTAIGGLI